MTGLEHNHRSLHSEIPAAAENTQDPALDQDGAGREVFQAYRFEPLQCTCPEIDLSVCVGGGGGDYQLLFVSGTKGRLLQRSLILNTPPRKKILRTYLRFSACIRRVPLVGHEKDCHEYMLYLRSEVGVTNPGARGVLN